jgi:phosphoglycerate dehydrogenase-like enzyme
MERRMSLKFRIVGPLPRKPAMDVLKALTFGANPDALFYTLPIRRDIPESVTVIASCTTGEQHLEGFKGTIISLANDPILETITPTAEHTFGLVWAVTRGVRALCFTDWDRTLYGGDRMLSKMALCVVGKGRLGKMVERIALGYGMTLTDDLGQADIVSLHVDLNETSRAMVNEQFIARMKMGSYLINTARGEVIDERAVLIGLKGGKLAGYAADVLSGEFGPDFDWRQHPLAWGRQAGLNIVLTPHVGGSTQDAWDLTQTHIAEKLVAYARAHSGS